MIEHLGAETYAYARVGGGELLTIATQNDRGIKAGDKFQASFEPSRALLFDAAGVRIR
jgi:lactose/L-arabinose transport system ATP-binding protein